MFNIRREILWSLEEFSDFAIDWLIIQKRIPIVANFLFEIISKLVSKSTIIRKSAGLWLLFEQWSKHTFPEGSAINSLGFIFH